MTPLQHTMGPDFAPERIIASDVVFSMLPVVLVNTLEHLAWRHNRLSFLDGLETT